MTRARDTHGWAMAFLFAIGAPLLAVALVVSTTLATADGPAALADTWAGILLMNLLGWAGYLVALFTLARYSNLVVFLGAFFACFIGLSMISNAIEERALYERGATTTCTVLEVTERVKTYHYGDGYTTRTEVSFDHELTCADTSVTEMTTGSRVAGQGKRIDVRYDPTDRINPRPTGPGDDPPVPLWPGLAVFGGGIMLRLLSELNVPLLESMD
jgi:hypothetical protein